MLRHYYPFGIIITPLEVFVHVTLAPAPGRELNVESLTTFDGVMTEI